MNCLLATLSNDWACPVQIFAHRRFQECLEGNRSRTNKGSIAGRWLFNCYNTYQYIDRQTIEYNGVAGSAIQSPVVAGVADDQGQGIVTARSNAPVFVVGCHRSGTALLYDSLLSAGGFPLYHHAPYVHTALIRICGDPAIRKNREKLWKLWLRSKPFRRTGLAADDIRSQVLRECRSGGDFLRITMGELARRAGVLRWAVHDCDNIFYIPVIKQEIPDALFVHVVRDGRDAALSMNRQHPEAPRGWLKQRSLAVWSLLWQWTVHKGRRFGQEIPSDYIEVRYEDLVQNPEQTLSTLGHFLDHDLDYSRIRKNAIGRVLAPNTIWKEESSPETFSPVNRWKTKLSQSEIAVVENLIGEALREFHYPLTTEGSKSGNFDPTLRMMRLFYPQYFETKLFLQSKTVVGRLAKGTRLELDPVTD